MLLLMLKMMMLMQMVGVCCCSQQDEGEVQRVYYVPTYALYQYREHVSDGHRFLQCPYAKAI